MELCQQYFGPGKIIEKASIKNFDVKTEFEFIIPKGTIKKPEFIKFTQNNLHQEFKSHILQIFQELVNKFEGFPSHRFKLSKVEVIYCLG